MVQTATRNNGTYARGCIYAVLATGSEGTSWAFDFEQYEFSPQQVTGVIFALSGVHATDPITGTPGQNTDSTSDTNFVVSSITTSYANSWAIAIAVSCGDSFPGAAPSTWSNSFTGIGSSAGAGTRATIGVGYKLISSPGAVGDATASYAGSSDTSFGFMLEVREAASTTKKLKLLAHSSAASATVDGIVWAVQAGGIAGAEIGEFTGKQFEAALEGGKAVLKVPVADFGGGSLNVNDQVKVFARNATNFSDIWTGTIIEE